MVNEKMVRWTAAELWADLTRKASILEIKELYKALLAREIGVADYTDAVDKVMTNALEDVYYDNDGYASFIDENIVSEVKNIAEAANLDIENW